jgi:hypothetical protein
MGSHPLRTATFGFIAGAVSFLVFHQVAFLVLAQLGVLNAKTYSLAATQPWGVPQVVSSAFWGGLWGIVASFLLRRRPGIVASVLLRRPSGVANPLAWIVFGATLPVMVAWFIVQPLKGLPAGGGFHMPALVAVPLVHAFWGFGMWVVLQVLRQVTGRPVAA